MKKAITAILTLTLALSVSLFAWCASSLRYAEGWGTFYWERHEVASMLSRYGLGEVVRRFFLQFFASPAMGVAVAAAVTLLFSLLMILLVRLVSRRTAMVYFSLIPTCSFLLCFLAFVSPNGLLALASHASDAGRQHDQYIALSNRARVGDWDGIIAQCESGGRVSNLLGQNFLNMALAERGQLGNRLFDEPCQDIRSIYIDVIQNEDFAALLSDIYYSMGHIAQSQRYAFELNEKKNDLSPRLLMRLVQTNIIYGQYAVAEKYLWWLRHTICYKEWAASQMHFLYNDKAVEADAEYGMKRRCLIADNRFSGIRGLDDDLLHVARQTRGSKQCQTTLQYLASLYILAHYDKHFVNLCKEFQEYRLPQQKYFGEYYRKINVADAAEGLPRQK